MFFSTLFCHVSPGAVSHIKWPIIYPPSCSFLCFYFLRFPNKGNEMFVFIFCILLHLSMFFIFLLCFLFTYPPSICLLPFLCNAKVFSFFCILLITCKVGLFSSFLYFSHTNQGVFFFVFIFLHFSAFTNHQDQVRWHLQKKK